MTTPGLSLVSPELVSRVENANERGRRLAALAACDLALERTGSSDERTAAARIAISEGSYGDVPERLAVRALTEELDQAAWDIQERAEAGTATQEDYARAFNKARAASALDHAFDPDSLTAALEALYEAHYAIEDLAALTHTVTGALSS